MQVLVNQCAGLHPQVLSQAFNVYVAKDGAGGLAAIGALQTIDLLKDLIVGLMKQLVELLGLAFFPVAHTFAHFGVLLGGFVQARPVILIHGDQKNLRLW